MDNTLRTPDRLTTGVEAETPIQKDIDFSSTYLKFGRSNLLAKDHPKWRSTNIDRHDDERDFLVTSVKDTTPEKNRWHRARDFLSQNYNRDRVIAHHTVPTPVDQNSKDSISQLKVASPITISSPLARRGATFYTNIKLQFGDKSNDSTDSEPLKPWKRMIKKNPHSEFKVQFDKIISSLDAKESSRITTDKTLVEPTGDVLLSTRDVPNRTLFGLFNPVKSRSVTNEANYLQQNEGAWVKVGTMNTHVASVRMQFNQNFFDSMGIPQTSDVLLNQARAVKVAAISKSFSTDSLIPNINDSSAIRQKNKCVDNDSKMDAINADINGQRSIHNSDQSNHAPAREVASEVNPNPYQLQVITKRPTLPPMRKSTYQSQVFPLRKSGLASPLRSTAMALVLHSGLPHFELTQRYRRFKEIYIPAVTRNDIYFPSQLFQKSNEKSYSSALVPYKSYSLVGLEQNALVLREPTSLQAMQMINSTEHTTLLVILFSTAILIGYLAILVTRRLIVMMNHWRKRRVTLYIARLEARAVESMVKGKFDKAIRLLEKGIKFILSQPGDQQLFDCAGFRHLLGKALASEGKFVAAEDAFRSVKLFYEEMISDDLYLARILEDLAMALQSQSQVDRQDEAYDLLSRALKMYEKEMMLAVIVIDSQSDTCDGASYHAQVYSARLMGDAVASADASYITEASCLSSNLSCSPVILPEGDDSYLGVECDRAVAELEAMLLPPTAVKVQETAMPHSAASIARRIDVARVRFEIGLVLEASGQLDDAAMIIEEAYNIFIEISTDCDRKALFCNEKNIVGSFIEQVQQKLLDLENMCLEEESDWETEEKLIKEPIDVGMMSDMTYECDIVSKNLQFTPMKRDTSRDSEKEGGSPDTVMIF